MPAPASDFAGGRMAVAARDALAAAIAAGAPGGLLCSDAGVFPRARGHVRHRPEGCPELIAIVCAGGGGWVRWPGGRADVGRGRILLLPPGLPHAYGAARSDPWTIHWMHLCGPAVAAWVAGELPAAAPAIRPCADLDRAAAACTRAWSALAGGDRRGDLLRAAGPGWELLLLISAGGDPPPAADDPRVERVEAWMRQHLDRAPAVAALAALAGCSPQHLTALFRRHRGRPPADHHQRLRLTEAARLLSATALPVAAVAAQLGYADPFHFSRRFRRAFGAPPARWRRRAAG